MPAASPTRPEYLTAAERVTRALRAAITSGALLAGTPIRQEEIAAQHRVSRMPVREAFRQLEAEGLLVIYPNRGALVAVLQPADIQEIYDIRTLLESEALRRAWPALTPTRLKQAAGLLDQLDREPESGAWSRLDEAFHMTLYEPAESPRLLDLIATLRRQVNHVYYLTRPPEAYRGPRQAEHRQIVAACRRGNRDAAVRALAAHLKNSAAAVAAYAGPPEGPGG
jgi:DNA-binding GntR family transcriptional regulator